LAIAGELVELGVASGEAEILAWGRLWQLDAMRQLGLRNEWNPAFIDLAATVERMASPSWKWRLATIQATLALQEDRIDDVPALVAAAAEAGVAAEVADAPMLDLILRSVFAQRTGDGLEQVEAEVRRAIAGFPFLAQGWRAQLLAQMGKADEAAGIWRSLAPHMDEMPPTATEWLVAHAGHAVLAVVAEDRDMAAHLRRTLEPFGSHHVAPLALSPYGGPVALVLGRLCAFLDDDEFADRWFRESVSRAEAAMAPWFATEAREELDKLGRALGPLSRREGQVARMIARGLTNRQIAEELVLSERTVEQHVRSILHKLDLSNRTSVAAWLADQ
jgi:DNA-binding CsgD family transcriptional regulator